MRRYRETMASIAARAAAVPPRAGSPTWTELWAGRGGEVVFLHGDARIG